MPVWFSAVLACCALALTVALVAAVVAAVGAVRRAERVLAALQREIDHDVPPLLGGLRELVEDLRRLSRGERIATSAAHAPIVDSVDSFVYSVVQGAQYCISPC